MANINRINRGSDGGNEENPPIRRTAFDVMMESAKTPGVFETDPLMKRRKVYEHMKKLGKPPEDFLVGVIGRGQVLRDLMAEVPEKDRGNLMTASINNIPNEMDFVDGVILISILSKIGILNLSKENNTSIDFKQHNTRFVKEWENWKDRKDWDDYEDWLDNQLVCALWQNEPWTYHSDENGRITLFTVANDAPYELPAHIGRLDRLERLGLAGNCLSIPVKELCKLERFQELFITGCSNLLSNDFPVQMKLKHLKFLYLHNSQFQSTVSFLRWMAAHFPSLEYLEILYMEENQTDIILDFLRGLDSASFKSNLKRLAMKCCHVNENHFQALMLEVLPKFENLFELNLWNNNIKSFQPIAEKIENETNCTVSNSIRRLQLSDNPVSFYQKKLLPKEKMAVLSILKSFKNLYSLGIMMEYDSDIHYARLINHAGRNIIEGDRDLPLSLWPAVLERAYKKAFLHIKKNPTGIFYLLLNRPALVGLSNLASTLQDCYDADSDDNPVKTVSRSSNKNPLKRKLPATEGFGDATVAESYIETQPSGRCHRNSWRSTPPKKNKTKKSKISTI